MGNQKLKILYCVQCLGKGGAERLILDICNHLNTRSDVDYLLVSFSQLNEYTTLSQAVNLKYCDAQISLSMFKRNKINIQSWQHIISDFKPDIIHSNVYFCELLTREITLPNVKYFTHCHNNMPEFASFGMKTLFSKNLLTKWYEKKRIEKRYKQCNNKFIAISKDTFDYYKKNLATSLRNNIYLLPNAINYNRFKSDTIKEITGTLNLIMIGHMADYKNQIFLIDVLEYLKNRNIDAKLTLLGDWRDLGAKILEKAKQKGLSDCLEMPGIVENVESYLSKQHIYVHSAYYEPFGLVLLEAMAAGLPVVCLDGGGNRDIIEDGKNGFMIMHENPVEFAEKIIELATNKNVYKSMSFYAQEYAKKYDIKEYVDSLLELYRI